MADRITMTHAAIGATYRARPGQVAVMQAAGWVVDPDAIPEPIPGSEHVTQTQLAAALAGVSGAVDDATTSTKGKARILGGTADAPTVPYASVTDKPTLAAVATSGSATDLTTGTIPDARIPATIARDTEVAAAVAAQAAALAPQTVVYVERYKTSGNTWQAAIQAALDFAETAGGGRVLCPPSQVIAVSKVGTISLIVSVSTVQQTYCLLIGSNVDLDLNGCTLRLANGQNASILVNKKILASGAADTAIAVRNGIFDVNCQNNATAPTQGTVDGITFANINGLTLKDLRFDNNRYSATRLMRISGFWFDNLICTYSDGDGFRFGSHGTTDTYDMRCFDGVIGTLQAENCMIGLNGTLQGNPVVVTLKNVMIGTLRAKACGGGIKLQDGCDGVTVGEMIFTGAAVPNANNSSLNSGIKIQGNGGSPAPPKNILAGVVHATDCQSTGLYTFDCLNVSIGRYIGVGNARDASTPDMRLDGRSVQIGAINSSGSGSTGLYVRPDAEDYHVGDVIVRDCGASAAVQIDGTGQGTIDSIDARDTRGASAVMLYGVRATSGAGMCRIGRLRAGGALTTAARIDNAFTTIGSLVLDPAAPLTGTVAPTVGATSTVVSNANIATLQTSTSKYLTPVIEIIAANSEAKALGTVTCTLATAGFSLTHAAAAGTEVFRWRVADWVPLAVAMPTTWTGGGVASSTPPQVGVFTTSGTWTKPAGATTVRVLALPGAPGGASGRRGAAGTVRCGGGGAGGGAMSFTTFDAADLPSTVAVTVGAGGTGAAAVTTDDTNGNNGGAGNASLFGTYLAALPGAVPVGGTNALGSAGAGGAGTSAGAAGGAASTTGLVGGIAGSAGGGGGGGAGGGISAANVPANGGAGTTSRTVNGTAGGAGGIVDTTLPTTVAAPTTKGSPGSGGGGGAASITTGAQAGAPGAGYGGGGGGGGASLNGNNSGAGGNGTPGYVMVITTF